MDKRRTTKQKHKEAKTAHKRRIYLLQRNLCCRCKRQPHILNKTLCLICAAYMNEQSRKFRKTKRYKKNYKHYLIRNKKRIRNR